MLDELCAVRKRRIGQRGSQTETMRRMKPLQHKLTSRAIAATFELHLPAPGSESTRGLAMTRCCRNAPAGLGRARDCRFGRPEQQKRPARLARGKAQALAFLEIEGLRDEACDGRSSTRAQTLFERPEGICLLACLDQCDAAGVEADCLKAMAIKLANGGVALRRGDDEDGALLGQ